MDKVDSLVKRINHLESEVSFYKQQLSKHEKPKNSSNSSIPPSQDENRPVRKSLRERSGRKPGGQKGHKGSTLKMTTTPDNTEMLVSDFCQNCGKDLHDVSPVFASKRQVVDLPEIKPIYTEYQCFSRMCSCGHEQVPAYPANVNNHIQYGASVEAAVGYYSVYQYLPFKRMSELFSHFYNLPISEGTIGNMLARMGKRARTIYDSIQTGVTESKSAVGSDETGARVNGQKYWAWIWQTVKYTFITVSKSRGKKVIEHFFPGGFKNAVLVSDRWASHINTYAKGHQLCLSHLLRELNYLIELEATAWATSVKTLLKKALELKREKLKYSRGDTKALTIETTLDQLLDRKLSDDETPKSLTFQKSLSKNRDYLFTFLYHKDVPPDNNASERGVRNFKVKLKISGQFKTGHGSFAKIRSVIDTFLKNNINVLDALQLVAEIPLISG